MAYKFHPHLHADECMFLYNVHDHFTLKSQVVRKPNTIAINSMERPGLVRSCNDDKAAMKWPETYLHSRWSISASPVLMLLSKPVEKVLGDGAFRQFELTGMEPSLMRSELHSPSSTPMGIPGRMPLYTVKWSSRHATMGTQKKAGCLYILWSVLHQVLNRLTLVF